jgi:hypothetical protein
VQFRIHSQRFQSYCWRSSYCPAWIEDHDALYGYLYTPEWSKRLTRLISDKLNPPTNAWDQNLYVDGQLQSGVSTSTHHTPPTSRNRSDLTDPTGTGQHGTYFYISVECASGTCANAPAHRKSFHQQP